MPHPLFQSILYYVRSPVTPGLTPPPPSFSRLDLSGDGGAVGRRLGGATRRGGAPGHQRPPAPEQFFYLFWMQKFFSPNFSFIFGCKSFHITFSTKLCFGCNGFFFNFFKFFSQNFLFHIFSHQSFSTLSNLFTLKIFFKFLLSETIKSYQKEKKMVGRLTVGNPSYCPL